MTGRSSSVTGTVSWISPPSGASSRAAVPGGARAVRAADARSRAGGCSRRLDEEDVALDPMFLHQMLDREIGITPGGEQRAEAVGPRHHRSPAVAAGP